MQVVAKHKVNKIERNGRIVENNEKNKGKMGKTEDEKNQAYWFYLLIFVKNWFYKKEKRR